MSAHKRHNPHMFLQKLNSSVSSLPAIKQGEPVLNFELESFQESDSEEPAKDAVENDADMEGQFSLWDEDAKTRRIKIWMKWVIILVASAFAMTLLFQIPSKSDHLSNWSRSKPQINPRGFTVEAFLNGTFSNNEETFKFLSPPQSTHLTKDDDKGLYITIENNGKQKDTIVAKQLEDREFYKRISPLDFEFNSVRYNVEFITVSYSLEYAIIGSNIVKEYRHSSSGLYWLYDIKNNNLKPIKPKDSKSPHPRLSYCHFSPSYQYLYFVQNNDLYVQTITDGSEAHRVTYDGSNNVKNGKTDWVYEEELLADDVAVWWAPGDSNVMFTKIDDSQVANYNYQVFINNKQTSSLKSMKYPLPGQTNPTIELLHYDPLSGNITHIINPNDLNSPLLYYARWIDENEILFKMTDRESKIMNTMVFDASTSQSRTLRVQNSNDYNGWIEKCFEIAIIDNSDKKPPGFVDILPDEAGYLHLFYFSSTTDAKPIQLTKGEWEAKNIVAYDRERDSVLFHANSYHPMSQQLHEISLDVQAEVKNLESTDRIEYSKVTTSPSCKYAIRQYLGPDVPSKHAGLFEDLMSTNKEEFTSVINLSEDTNLAEALRSYEYPISSYYEMVLNDSVKINYIEVKPKNFDGSRKHPLLVQVYGGPGSETFNAKFTTGIEESLASSLGAIVLKIEPRGTGGRGWKFRSWANKNIGTWEAHDIIEVTKRYINENKAWIDLESTAVWGWSYGGFTTLRALESDQGRTFKYGVAVAPVTNWMHYDSVYTERYLGSPTNSEPYGNNTKIKDHRSFSFCKRFMVIHGTADDNVHIQNTYELLDDLNLNNVRNYDVHIFPDSDHSIYHHNAQRIVYQKIFYWIKDAFLGKLDDIE